MIKSFLLFSICSLAVAAPPLPIPPKSPGRKLPVEKVVVDGTEIRPGSQDGVNDDSRVVRDSAVRISFKTPTGELRPVCSGTLLKNGKLLTAGHCFDPQCGVDELKQGLLVAEVFNPATQKYESHTLKNIKKKVEDRSGPNLTDLAILDLDPMPALSDNLPEIATETCDFVRETTKPTSDNPKNFPLLGGGFGTTEKAERNLNWGRYNGRGFHRRLNITRGDGAKFCGGDSGAGVLCQIKGKWAVTGVMTGGNEGFESAIRSGIAGAVKCLSPHVANAIAPSKDQKIKYCREATDIVASRVQGNLDLLRSWQNDQTSPARPGAPNGARK